MYVRIIVLFFNLFVLLSSLIGDSTILIGIIRYNAIKLNKATVVFILHLAVNDMLQAMFSVLPQTINIAMGSEHWLLGEVVCDLFDNVQRICSDTSTPLLTSLLSTSKMLTIFYPFRARTWSNCKVHVICGICWTVSVLQPVVIYNVKCIIDPTYYNTDYYYRCNCYSDTTPFWVYQWFYHFVPAIVPVICIFILIITSVLILYKARKQALSRGGTLRWQGVMTITMTTAVFVISYLPFNIFNVSIFLGIIPTAQYIVLFKVFSFMLNINIMANFFVYSVTVQSFRDFIWSGILSVARRSRSSGRQFLGPFRQPTLSNEDRFGATRGPEMAAISNVEPGSLVMTTHFNEEHGRIERTVVSNKEPGIPEMTAVFNEEDRPQIAHALNEDNH